MKQKNIKKNLQKLQKNIAKRPVPAFYLSLVAVVLLIIVGNIIRKPEVVKNSDIKAPQKVSVYSIGDSPKISVIGEVEKSGVVKIVSLTGGVVQNIYTHEGMPVNKWAVLMNISSNYTGGNAQSTQRQLAAVQYQTALDTYDSQKDIIAKQKEIAQKAESQSAQVRDITNQSTDATKDLIALNDSIISSLDSNMTLLQADPVANASLILASKQAKSQFLAAQNQAKAGLRVNEYQSSSDKEPAHIAQLQRDTAIAQLNLQEKMLDVQKEVSRLQLSLARIAEGATAPASPFNGVVQRIFVKVGQAVSPGTPLAIVSQTKDDPITVIAYVSRDIATKINTETPAELVVHGEKITVKPHFVSNDSLEAGLYGVYFNLPDSFISKVTDRDHVMVNLILDGDSQKNAETYIPIDAVHQTSSESFVYVAKDSRAVAKKVIVGTVFGSMVHVEGLNQNDKVILDRNITQASTIEIVH